MQFPHFFRLSVSAFTRLFVAVRYFAYDDRIFQKGHVRYERSTFFSIELSPRRFAYNFWRRQRVQRSRLARSLYDRTNVTMHKSMVTWLNTAWIYRTRLSPLRNDKLWRSNDSGSISGDERVTMRARAHRVTCNMGCAMSFSEGNRESIDGDRRAGGLLYARRLLATNTDFPYNGVIPEGNERLGTALRKYKFARTVICMIMHFFSEWMLINALG